MNENLNSKEKLIYSLLFSSKIEYEIDINKYCTNDERSEFREEIRKIIKTAEITITEDRIIHNDDIIIWKINIKRT